MDKKSHLCVDNRHFFFFADLVKSRVKSDFRDLEKIVALVLFSSSSRVLIGTPLGTSVY